MSRDISQIVADLLAQSVEGKDVSSQIQHLGEEIRRIVQRDETIYGKFRRLLESFLAIIPDEQQRYLAALQALSTTAKLNRHEVMKALNGQLEELKIVEQGAMPSLAGWLDTLKAMEARQQAIKSELGQLRERIAQLESENRMLLSLKAAREQNLGQAEKTIRGVFAAIGAEIIAVNRKMAELPAEGAAGQAGPPPAQPAPPVAQPAVLPAPVKNAAPVEKPAEIQAAPAPAETKYQKKCPMCGGSFNLLEFQNLWQCFSCAYEEPASGAVQGTSESRNAPAPAPDQDPIVERSSPFLGSEGSLADDLGGPKGPSELDNQPAIKKKTCPACRRKMYWYPNEKAWRCPDCQYERRI